MKPSINIHPNLIDADKVYQHILTMHNGLSDEESAKANAKLILMLANHIGDEQVIAAATSQVRANTESWRT